MPCTRVVWAAPTAATRWPAPPRSRPSSPWRPTTWLRGLEIGDILTDRLGRLAEKYDEVGEARGRGAMIAMELVTDAESKEPAAALTSAVNKGCHERGLVTLTCGTYGNVFRFLPPLSISDDLLHEGMDVLEESFTAAVG